VTSDASVAGLGFTLDVTGYAPWKEERGSKGLAMLARTAKDLHVGVPSDVSLDVRAPAGEAFTVRYALPAGVEPNTASLEELKASPAITDYAVEGQTVRFEVAEIEPGETARLRFRVVPTLAGRLHSGASSIELANRTDVTANVPPSTWVIR
jgi:hypothetical protein